MTLYVGTSGWEYAHWRGRFYPRAPGPHDDLAYYAARLATVEVNGTFYRLPDADVFDDWARRTPDDFVFAIKASRYLSHIKRLKEPAEPVERLMSRARRLGAKLGPVLLQLPPNMRRDAGRLRETLRAFGPATRVAVEFREASWFAEEVRALLAAHNAALCLADRESRLVTPEWRTADWGYIRFHYGTGSPPGGYGRAALDARAALLRRLFGDADVYAYFNNDGYACALRDARTFALAAARHGLKPTRVPGPHDVRVG